MEQIEQQITPKQEFKSIVKQGSINKSFALTDLNNLQKLFEDSKANGVTFTGDVSNDTLLAGLDGIIILNDDSEVQVSSKSVAWRKEDGREGIIDTLRAFVPVTFVEKVTGKRYTTKLYLNPSNLSFFQQLCEMEDKQSPAHTVEWSNTLGRKDDKGNIVALYGKVMIGIRPAEGALPPQQ